MATLNQIWLLYTVTVTLMLVLLMNSFLQLGNSRNGNIRSRRFENRLQNGDCEKFGKPVETKVLDVVTKDVVRYQKIINYLPSTKKFPSESSLTLATQCSWHYVHHLMNLLEKHNGPISAALYVPGDSFNFLVNAIMQMRKCFPKFSEQVTISLFFPTDAAPCITSREFKQVPKVNCSSLLSPLTGGPDLSKYGGYPINVGRNAARLAVSSEYVLLLDVELVPTPNLTEKFFEMMDKKRDLIVDNAVYVLPVFEVAETGEAPTDKRGLVRLLRQEKAVPFHYSSCDYCHTIPYLGLWINANPSRDLREFFMNKWVPPAWEPVYIGDNTEPMHDERFRGYGRNKIQQVFEMCLQDYSFHILDNAFLVHKGTSDKSKKTKNETMIQTNLEMYRHYLNDILGKYSNRPDLQAYCLHDNPEARSLTVGYFATKYNVLNALIGVVPMF